VQQLLDCSAPEGNRACGGGDTIASFLFFSKNSVCTDASYRYAGNSSGSCKSCTEAIPEGFVRGYRSVQPHSQMALQQAVLHGPVSVGIEADQRVFQFYKAGILNSSDCGTFLDHAVLLVGFGASVANIPYWKLKNSWGTSWGLEGYMLLERGMGKDGECGLLESASYPVVAFSPAPPPPRNATRYEEPPCSHSDEIEVVVMASGKRPRSSLCAPRCAADGWSCDPDVPFGRLGAIPKCLLTDMFEGDSYCGLTCNAKEDCPVGSDCLNVTDDEFLSTTCYKGSCQMCFFQNISVDVLV